MNKKGFTLVELIAVLVILGILVAVGVPVYMAIRDNVLESQYENVVTRIETAAQSYAQDANAIDVVDVNVEFLIQNGYLTPDDETDIYDPRDDSSLNCYMLHVTIEDNSYIATMDTKETLEDDGTCSLYVSVGDYHIYCNDNLCTTNWYAEDQVLTLYKGEELIDSSEIEWTSLLGVYEVASSTTASPIYLMNTTYIATYKEDGTTYKTSQVIRIDKEKPVINEISYENSTTTWVQSNTLYVSASDRNGSGIYGYALIDSTSSCESASYQTDNSFSLSNNTYKVCVMDNVGNIIESDEIVIDNIDTEAPDMELDFSPTGWTTEVELTFSASDDASGIRGYAITTTNSQPDVYIDANRTSEYTNWNGTQLSVTETENNTYYLWVVDNVGNVTSKSVTVSKIDRVTPEGSITAVKKSASTTVSNDTWSNSGLNFTITTDTCGISGCTIYYCVDTTNTCTPSTEVTSGTTITSYNSQTGIYYIRYYIISGAGVSSGITTYTAKVDTTAPTTPTVTLKEVNSSGSTISDATWTTGNVYTVASGSTDSQSGLDHYEYYTSTSNTTPTSSGTSGSTKTVSTENTSYIFYRACDKVDNCSAWVLKTIMIDSIAPSCNYSGESTTWINSSRTITVTCSDSGSGCNSSYSSNSYTYSTTTKTASISYTIKDVAGNSTVCSKTANVYVDKTAPTCSTSKSNLNTTSGVTVSISCSDANSGVSTCAGTNGSSSSKSGVKSSATYTVTDVAGNSNTCSVSVSTATIDGSCLDYSYYDCNCTDHYTTSTETVCASYNTTTSCSTCTGTQYFCEYNGSIVGYYSTQAEAYSECGSYGGGLYYVGAENYTYSCNCSSTSSCSSWNTITTSTYSYTSCDTCSSCNRYEQLTVYR